jgi:hypothetical protein
MSEVTGAGQQPAAAQTQASRTDEQREAQAARAERAAQAEQQRETQAAQNTQDNQQDQRLEVEEERGQGRVINEVA